MGVAEAGAAHRGDAVGRGVGSVGGGGEAGASEADEDEDQEDDESQEPSPKPDTGQGSSLDLELEGHRSDRRGSLFDSTGSPWAHIFESAEMKRILRNGYQEYK